MNKIKRLVAVVVSILTLSMMVGCGSFDASGYVKGLLDNSYKNDSSTFVAQKIGTAEEAQALYQEGIDAEMEGLLQGVDLSDEVAEKWENTLKELFAKADYKVLESEKQDDGSYVVSVEYKQMKVFGTAMEAVYEQVASLEYVDEADLYNQIFNLLADNVKANINKGAEYDEAQKATITVAPDENNVYYPNEEDIYNLETVLFDLDALQ